MRVLAKLEALTLVRSEKVRGATERFYRFALDGQTEWVRVVLKDTEAGDATRITDPPRMWRQMTAGAGE